ncbi:hypothetical protein PL321_10860 [Caloramator sp. mosi_1]|uniref:hypothetical protein n=1 Tax=Caloramator sp. mosi_1 TaxID=3023090 RepID=UPI002361B72E|nr:hypothetical protein [Caloramator sp. mosi_1]WDC83277.1 hypothetical protein PL321_10860 [Caloramator sp. mosi_1]
MYNFYKQCIKYLYADEFLPNKIEELYSCIKKYGDIKIIKWFEENYIFNKNFSGYSNYMNDPLKVGYINEKSLVIDTSKFNVFNVFEASKLYRNILGY